MLICALCGAVNKLHTYMWCIQIFENINKNRDFLGFFLVFWGNLLEFFARFPGWSGEKRDDYSKY